MPESNLLTRSEDHVAAVRTMVDEDARVAMVYITEEVAISREVSLPSLMRSFVSARFTLAGYLTNSPRCKRLPGWLGGLQCWLDSMVALQSCMGDGM